MLTGRKMQEKNKNNNSYMNLYQKIVNINKNDN